MAHAPARIHAAPAARARIDIGTRGTDRLSLADETASSLRTLFSLAVAVSVLWTLFT